MYCCLYIHTLIFSHICLNLSINYYVHECCPIYLTKAFINVKINMDIIKFMKGGIEVLIKKAAAFTMAATLLVCIFSGCGSGKDNSQIVGKWTPTTASLNGETVKYSSLGLDESEFGFTFKDNGKCTATLASVTGEGTYTFNGTSVDIEINKETKKLNYDNGSLTLTLDYDNDTTTFTFTKQK